MEEHRWIEWTSHCLGAALAVWLVACGGDEASSAASVASTSASSGGGGSGGGTSSATGGSSSTGGAPGAYDFSCQSAPWPSTGPDPVHIDGTVFEAFSLLGVGGVAVEALATADGATLASTMSQATGAYGFVLPTGGDALEMYMRATKADYVTGYAFPPYALWEDSPGRSVQMLSVADRLTIAADAGVTLDPTKSVVAVLVKDCGATTVAGATVSFSPPAEVVLVQGEDGAFHRGDTTTTQGIVIGLNHPAGPLDATITLDGKVWRTWTVQSFADSLVWTPRRP